MKMNKQRLEETADFLRSNPNFCRGYARPASIRNNTYGKRRSFVATALYESRWKYDHDIEDRDQLRRYFDNLYKIPQAEVNKYGEIPDMLDDAHDFPAPAPKSIRPKLPTPTPTPTPETNMTKPITITTKTFVNGVDISTMADAEVYDLIAQQESEIERLAKIKARPRKLVEELAKRQAGIDLLVAYLDSVKA